MCFGHRDLHLRAGIPGDVDEARDVVDQQLVRIAAR